MTTTTDEIVNYVMETPQNANPSVLRSLLSQHSGESIGEIMEQIQELEETKQDKLTAGDGVTIEDNVVSSPPEIYPVIAEYDSSTGNTIVNKTHAEIRNALSENKIPVLFERYEGESEIEYYILFCDTSEPYGEIGFFQINPTFLPPSDGHTESGFTREIRQAIFIYEDDSVEVYSDTKDFAIVTGFVRESENSGQYVLDGTFSQIRRCYALTGCRVVSGGAIHNIESSVIEVEADVQSNLYTVKTNRRTYTTNSVNGYPSANM